MARSDDLVKKRQDEGSIELIRMTKNKILYALIVYLLDADYKSVPKVEGVSNGRWYKNFVRECVPLGAFTQVAAGSADSSDINPAQIGYFHFFN